MSAKNSLTPTSSEECSMHPMPLRYIWSEDSTSAFQEALSSSALQLQIDHFLSKTDIQILTLQRLNWPIFLLMQLISLLKSLKKHKITTKHNKSFDDDLRSSRQNLINLGKVYIKYPKGRTI
jgi:ATP-dependent helicase/DNAse subunit B